MCCTKRQTQNPLHTHQLNHFRTTSRSLCISASVHFTTTSSHTHTHTLAYIVHMLCASRTGNITRLAPHVALRCWDSARRRRVRLLFGRTEMRTGAAALCVQTVCGSCVFSSVYVCVCVCVGAGQVKEMKVRGNSQEPLGPITALAHACETTTP